MRIVGDDTYYVSDIERLKIELLRAAEGGQSLPNLFVGENVLHGRDVVGIEI